MMGQNTSSPALTVEQLAEIADTQCCYKQYNSAIKVYSQAIECEQEDSNKIKAVIYLRRAFCKQQLNCEYVFQDIENDIKNAIRLDPLLANAYLQLAKLYRTEERYEDAYIELQCAMSLKEAIKVQEFQMEWELRQQAHIEKGYSWQQKAKHDGLFDKPKNIPHRVVHQWLALTERDILRNDFLLRLNKENENSNSTKGAYDTALSFIVEKKYKKVADMAATEDPSHPKFLESCLLAARFYVYLNGVNCPKAEQMMECFNRELKVSEAISKKRRKQLMSTELLIRMKRSQSEEEMQIYFAKAEELDKNNPDFYIEAAAKLSDLGLKKAATYLLQKNAKRFRKNAKILLMPYALRLFRTEPSDESVLKSVTSVLFSNFISTLKDVLNRRVPISGYVSMMVAETFLTIGNYTNAFQSNDMALEKCPHEADFWFQRGEIHRATLTEKYEPEIVDKAVSCYKKCLKEDPCHPGLYSYLELAYEDKKKRNQSVSSRVTQDDLPNLVERGSRLILSQPESLGVPYLEYIMDITLQLQAEKEVKRRFSSV